MVQTPNAKLSYPERGLNSWRAWTERRDGREKVTRGGKGLAAAPCLAVIFQANLDMSHLHHSKSAQ